MQQYGAVYVCGQVGIVSQLEKISCPLTRNVAAGMCMWTILHTGAQQYGPYEHVNVVVH